ncbi:MAG: hypothetical protein K6F94_05460 [Bacteroidaceae bacterium]|nr:hypothetical protein [Bacteroidaceae bacterium]
MEVILLTVVSGVAVRWLLPPVSAISMTRFLVIIALTYSVVQLQIGTKMLTGEQLHVVFHHSLLTVFWFIVISQLMLWITRMNIGTALFYAVIYVVLFVVIPLARFFFVRMTSSWNESIASSSDVHHSLQATPPLRSLDDSKPTYIRSSDIPEEQSSSPSLLVVIYKRCADILAAAVFLLTFFPIIYFLVAIYTKFKNKGPVIIQKRNRRLCFRSVNSPMLKRMPEAINVLFGQVTLVGPGENVCIQINDKDWYWREWNTTFDLYLLLHTLFKRPSHI